MAKQTCESTRRISMSFLRKEGYVYKTNKQGIIFWESNKKTVASIRIKISLSQNIVSFACPYSGRVAECSLTRTQCFFGGSRYWFVCPVGGCKKRVGVLYLIGAEFGCRTCHDLVYRSQQETHTGYLGAIKKNFVSDWELMDQLRKIRVKYWKGRPTKRYQKWLNKKSTKISFKDINRLLATKK